MTSSITHSLLAASDRASAHELLSKILLVAERELRGEALGEELDCLADELFCTYLDEIFMNLLDKTDLPGRASRRCCTEDIARLVAGTTIGETLEICAHILGCDVCRQGYDQAKARRAARDRGHEDEPLSAARSLSSTSARAGGLSPQAAPPAAAAGRAAASTPAPSGLGPAGLAVIINFLARNLIRRRHVQWATDTRAKVDVVLSDDKRLNVIVEMGEEGMDDVPATLEVTYDVPETSRFQISWRLVDAVAESQEIGAGEVPMRWNGKWWEGELRGLRVPRGEPQLTLLVIPEVSHAP